MELQGASMVETCREVNSPLTLGFLPKCMGFETASSHPCRMPWFKLFSVCFCCSFRYFPNRPLTQMLVLYNETLEWSMGTGLPIRLLLIWQG